MKLTKQATTINQAGDILLSRQNIALFCHTNPDGDTVGASIALALCLHKLGKHVDIFCDAQLSDKLSSFEQTSLIKKQFSGKYDLYVAVDCGDIFRLGEFSGYYSNFAETLTIDHHGGEFYSKYNCLSRYASTCQMIFEIANCLGVQLDSTIATYLYMGLCTDTGNFAHNNTDSDSFLMAAELCKLGAQMERVYTVFFRDTTLGETKLLARSLSKMRLYYDNQLALVYVTKKDLQELSLDMSATSGLVYHAINIDSVKVGVCITEYADNTYKVSMRGKNFDVRKVCQEFGGGGHVLASGCMISGYLEDVLAKIERVVGYYL